MLTVNRRNWYVFEGRLTFPLWGRRGIGGRAGRGDARPGRSLACGDRYVRPARARVGHQSPLRSSRRRLASKVTTSPTTASRKPGPMIANNAPASSANGCGVKRDFWLGGGPRIRSWGPSERCTSSLIKMFETAERAGAGRTFQIATQQLRTRTGIQQTSVCW
jgi:hypothetical protein